MSEQHKAPPPGLTGTVDHQDAGDGWLVVRLMTKQALLREGRHMDHCLQDGCYDELAGEEELTGDAIWSLRDPAGVSWATVEIQAARVITAKGPENRDVRRSAARRLQALVMAFRAAGTDLDFNGETELVMADDGRVMREDQAPAEVREQSRARHAARMRAQRDRLPQYGAGGGMFRAAANVLVASTPAMEDAAYVFGPWVRRPTPEPDLLAMTASLPNPVTGLVLTWEHQPNGLRGRATLRDGQVADVVAEGHWQQSPDETRRILAGHLFNRVLALQPPRTASMGSPRRGDIFRLTDEPVTDVVVTVAGEALREGDDYGVDAACGAVEFKRDVEGQVDVAYRITFDPNRWVLTLGVDTMDIRQDENPHRSVMAPVYDPILTSREWCERELLIVGGGASGLNAGGGFPGGGGGGRGVAVSRPVQARIVTTWSGQVVVPRRNPLG